MAVSSSRSARFSCSMTFGLPFMAGFYRKTGWLQTEKFRASRPIPVPCSLFPAFSQVLLHHALPGGPVVRVLRIPDAELVGNALLVHDPVENLVLAQALVVPAGGRS